MRKLLKHIFVLLTVLSQVVFAQQDPQYNLYQFNPLIINPAYSGYRDVISVVGNVRNQWVGFEGAPKTSIISVHAPVFTKNLGIGGTIIGDRIGPRNMVGIMGNFAYNVKIANDWKLALGLGAGYNRYQFNYSQIQFKFVENSAVQLNDLNTGNLDFNTGFLLRSKKFFFGFSATHLFAKNLFSQELKEATNSSSTLNYRLHTHTHFYLGRSFMINENLIFSPTIMFRTVSEGEGNLDLNFNFFIKQKVWLGLFFRGPYGPGIIMNFYLTESLRVGYSYDVGVGAARRLGPSHEITIGYDFKSKKSKIISPRFL
ncbi:MAG: type IX secretion system membrane protein PorP/SprF [Bacteroidia bacterium]